ncbi:glucosidase 2 subunit beta-like [Saccoglossus kowalevskii]|uniref:Glucosidase 2 subunit beta n=1 Tax=Saccoglossus kowalevskii TaxID=10224 RepID=A0ABM0M7Z9_SACKO|nr:PREDICTED: glucosidase 2 subunit beta-like [Saccoglossus kowalevskii]
MAMFSVSFVKLSCSFYKYNAIFLFFVVTGSVLPQQVSRPRGVSLTNKPFYENKVTFTCLDGSLKIPFSQVNDDYCDCKDGTDEPGTAACTNGQFHCTNAGHKPLYLPSSRVNDGICDCCDTSDEYDGKVTCDNNCKELGREAKAKKIEEMQAFNEGYRIRQDYVAEGKQLRDENQVDEPPPPIDIDVEDVEGGDINPDDYPDDDYPDSYIDEEDEDEDDYSPPRRVHRHKKDDDDEMPEYDEETKVLIEIADKAREEFRVEDARYNKINTEITDLEKVLSLDLGGDNEFYFLEGKCFEYHDKEYTYKFCPFEKVSQKKSGKETSLGKWKGWEGPEGNKYSKMKYDGGERCWNGPDRSTLVNLRCGIDNVVITAFEPNRCEYEMEFKTPALCNQIIDPEALIDKHDEL